MLEIVGVALAVVSPLRAQPAADPHRWAVQLAGDAGSVPDVSCDNKTGGTPGYGVGLSVLHRVRSHVVAIADVRGAGVAPFTGCRAIVPAPTPIGPSEYETGPRNSYPGGMPEENFVRSALRVGVESGRPYPMARATIGGGLFWATRTPFATAGVDVGTRGDGVRLTIGIETSRAWLNVDRVFTRFRWDGTTQTPLASRTESDLRDVGWTMVHLGLELPLR